jgi:hypothetical protein
VQGTASTAPAASRPRLVRHGVAYGLRLSGGFQAPGLWSGVGDIDMRSVRLEVATPGEVARSWLSRGRDGGHLVRADGFGAYLIDPDGRRILLAPGPVDSWRWQRLLTAQAIPVAALLQGLELFHASAVQLDGRVLAFAGASRAGKSTLATWLLLAGATFVADDVLAVERDGDAVIAHPGPPLMNLRESTLRWLDSDERARVGTQLGCDEGGARLHVRRRAPARPLHAIYLLRPRRAREIHLKRLSPPKPAQLLGAAFGSAIRTPERLVRRLDLCAHLARHVPMFELEAPAQAPPDAIVEALLDHAHARAS